jgi:hypothetical protein
MRPSGNTPTARPGDAPASPATDPIGAALASPPPATNDAFMTSIISGSNCPDGDTDDCALRIPSQDSKTTAPTTAPAFATGPVHGPFTSR